VTAADLEELREACLLSCRGLAKAYANIIRRNVEATCRSRQIENQEVVEQMVSDITDALRKK